MLVIKTFPFELGDRFYGDDLVKVYKAHLILKYFINFWGQQ